MHIQLLLFAGFLCIFTGLAIIAHATLSTITQNAKHRD